jgi:hypothetical protein
LEIPAAWALIYITPRPQARPEPPQNEYRPANFQPLGGEFDEPVWKMVERAREEVARVNRESGGPTAAGVLIKPTYNCLQPGWRHASAVIQERFSRYAAFMRATES